MCSNVSPEQTHISSWLKQRSSITWLTGNVYHLYCHMQNIYLLKSTLPAAQTPVSKMTLPSIKIPGAQIRRSTSLTPRRIRAYRIYRFLERRSRKHKLQETFMVSHASWRKHSTFDPWTVKTTAGIYKGGEKGASLPPVEIGRWNSFTVQTYQIHQHVIFATFYQQQLDLTPRELWLR